MLRFFWVMVLAMLPAASFASDPTPLFVPFVALPLVATSLFAFFWVYIRARNAMVSNLVLLVVLLLVVLWASDVGYMKTGGMWVWFALAINGSAIVLWWIRAGRDPQ